MSTTATLTTPPPQPPHPATIGHADPSRPLMHLPCPLTPPPLKLVSDSVARTA